MDKLQLICEIGEIRIRLEQAFGPETAMRNSSGAGPSAGHCAVVAAIVFQRFGGKLVSSIINGESHWFNRLNSDQGWLDVDLTADQFGGDSVLVRPLGTLYNDSKDRSPDDLNLETLRRAQVLADKANIDFDCSLLRTARSG